jgi:ABC exporter DevB family membrane fusion protein
MKSTAIMALLIMLALAAYALFSRDAKSPLPATHTAVRSHVAAEGKVEAMPGFDVDVASGELNGKVQKILVREGDTVAAGQLVAVLENADLQARVKAAEEQMAVARSKLAEVKSGARKEEILQAVAALEGATADVDEAGKQLQRYRELQRQGMVSPASLDERERAYKAARARATEAEQQKLLLEKGPKPETVKLYQDQARLAEAELEYSRKLVEKTQVHAPITGTVIRRYLDDGEGITPEIPILAIADTGRLWINAEVDETDTGRVHVGDRASVASDAYPGKVFNGRVKQIADYAGARRVKPSNPAVNLGLKVVQVKIGLDEHSPFKLGMTVDVKILPQRQ